MLCFMHRIDCFMHKSSAWSAGEDSRAAVRRQPDGTGSQPEDERQIRTRGRGYRAGTPGGRIVPDAPLGRGRKRSKLPRPNPSCPRGQNFKSRHGGSWLWEWRYSLLWLYDLRLALGAGITVGSARFCHGIIPPVVILSFPAGTALPGGFPPFRAEPFSLYRGIVQWQNAGLQNRSPVFDSQSRLLF